MNPTIDVIFPISDSWLVPYLRNACRSIVAQNYPQELIKIYISWYFKEFNDSVAEVADLAREFEAVLLFNRWTDPAFSIGKAYNHAVRCGCREVVGCFDSDVVFHPDTFKHAAKHLVDGHSAIINVGRSNFTPENEKELVGFISGVSTYDELPSRRDGVGNILIPRFLFEKLHGFDERMYGWGGIDTDLHYRIERTIKPVFLQDYGCHKSIHQYHKTTETCESEFTARNRHILSTSTSLIRNERLWGGLSIDEAISEDVKSYKVVDQ